MTAALVFSWRYFKEIGTLFTALMLVFLGAMAGFSLTGDLFNLFVFFELMSVAAYALTGYKIEEEQALEGALNFAITNSIGAFLVLIGIGLLYGRTGALNLAQIGQALASGPADGLVIVALALITGGVRRQGGPCAVSLLAGRRPRRRANPGLRAVLRRHGGVGPVRRSGRIYWTVFAGVDGPACARRTAVSASGSA